MTTEQTPLPPPTLAQLKIVRAQEIRMASIVAALYTLIRDRRGVTQAQFADELCVHQSTVSRVECARVAPSLHYGDRVMRVTGMSRMSVLKAAEAIDSRLTQLAFLKGATHAEVEQDLYSLALLRVGGVYDDGVGTAQDRVYAKIDWDDPALCRSFSGFVYDLAYDLVLCYPWKFYPRVATVVGLAGVCPRDVNAVQRLYRERMAENEDQQVATRRLSTKKGAR